MHVSFISVILLLCTITQYLQQYKNNLDFAELIKTKVNNVVGAERENLLGKMTHAIDVIRRQTKRCNH